MNASPFPDVVSIVARTRQLESSNGTKGLAATCKAKGLSNDYGYNIPNCYPKGEDTRLVTEWFQKRFSEGLSLSEAGCLYTTGKITTDCERANQLK